jgi:hypothetical protein
MPACSEEDTLLSINVNLSASELNRQADLWEPIQVEIAKGRNVKQITVPLQTGSEEIDEFDAGGDPVLNDKGEVAKLKTDAVKARFFERITLDSSFAGDVVVTARATGAYKMSQTVDGKTLPKSMSGFEFVSGDDESDRADADTERYTISVRETPTPIEEEGVSAVFLDFRGPGTEPTEEPPPGAGGSDSAGAGGEAPSTGGSGGNGGSGGATGGSVNGGGDGGATEPAAGGETSSGGSPEEPPADGGSEG